MVANGMGFSKDEVEEKIKFSKLGTAITWERGFFEKLLRMRDHNENSFLVLGPPDAETGERDLVSDEKRFSQI